MTFQSIRSALPDFFCACYYSLGPGQHAQFDKVYLCELSYMHVQRTWCAVLWCTYQTHHHHCDGSACLICEEVLVRRGLAGWSNADMCLWVVYVVRNRDFPTLTREESLW